VLPDVCSDLSVFFLSGISTLDTAALQLFTEHAVCFDNRYVYEIEGHCDERGTTEYNLSLGQRRAEIVQKHLLSLGILPDRISTVSYGEERPSTSGSGDDVWSQNRRAVIRVQD
jgi:peptidoglycan-associated lipoprotein